MQKRRILLTGKVALQRLSKFCELIDTALKGMVEKQRAYPETQLIIIEPKEKR